MNTVIRHIEYLISRTDCVIIPGLGALLARYVGASYCAESQCFMPPHRTFSFNSALNNSDGALACSIARAEGISFESASEKVKTDVEAMTRQLYAQGQLSLGRAGTLSLDAESGSVLFAGFDEDKLSVATAWLPVVLPRPVVAEVVGLSAPVSVRPVSPFVRVAKVAASVALLIGISIVASTPISVHDATLASLCPEVKHVDADDLMPAGAEPEEAEIVSIEIVNVDHRPLYVEEQPKDYLVVIGSFVSETEADAYIAHKGLDAKIFEKNGRYRIYSQSFATESEAYAAIAQMPANVGAWVCKR